MTKPYQDSNKVGTSFVGVERSVNAKSMYSFAIFSLALLTVQLLYTVVSSTATSRAM